MYSNLTNVSLHKKKYIIIYDPMKNVYNIILRILWFFDRLETQTLIPTNYHEVKYYVSK